MKLYEVNETFLYEDLIGPKAARAEFIKKTLGAKWSGLPGYQNIDDFLEKIAAADPTKKGIYMPWIARLAISKPDINRMEDLDRLTKDLVKFEELKAKIPNKDINSYKSYYDLADIIDALTKPKKKSKEEIKAAREMSRLNKVKEGIDIVYQGPEGWIRIPRTCEAATFLGQSTKWCTTRKEMFNNYNNTDVLFVIYDKETKSRFQLHAQTGQFADVRDKLQGIETVPVWAQTKIINWYKENKPNNMKLSQLINLSKIGGHELAVGTDHADLLKLMKQYGI